MAEKTEKASHAEALKSTSIIGGSTAIVMLIRMVRTKVMAILLGPAGIGLEAMFDAVMSVARNVVDLGISSSGVRQIASAVGTGDQPVISRTVFTLRRVCLVLGVVGAATLFLVREKVSRLAFDTPDHASDIGLLSIVVLFSGIAGGQAALLQGMRRIGDLARMNIFGALAGAIVSIPIVFVWGKEGIPAYLVIVSGAALLVSWFYTRRIQVEVVSVPLREVLGEARSLLKLGLVFLWSGLMTAGALFLIRVFVTHHSGVDGAGQFQAANALSMVYVGFILQAMGTDFYPRLTAAAHDNQRCNQLVNEQAEISILLALPGILATLALAPWVIEIFYSDKFTVAAVILCWQITGMLLRVCSWPMGFIILAKGHAAALFWTELAAYSMYTGLAWLGLKFFGLPGAGMAFLGLYIFHWLMIYAVVRKISGFAWSPSAMRLSLLGVGAAFVCLTVRLTVADPWGTIISFGIAVVSGIYCLKVLLGLVGTEVAERYLQKVGLSWLFKRFMRWGRKVVPVSAE